MTTRFRLLLYYYFSHQHSAAQHSTQYQLGRAGSRRLLCNPTRSTLTATRSKDGVGIPRCHGKRESMLRFQCFHQLQTYRSTKSGIGLSLMGRRLSISVVILLWKTFLWPITVHMVWQVPSLQSRLNLFSHSCTSSRFKVSTLARSDRQDVD